MGEISVRRALSVILLLASTPPLSLSGCDNMFAEIRRIRNYGILLSDVSVTVGSREVVEVVKDNHSIFTNAELFIGYGEELRVVLLKYTYKGNEAPPTSMLVARGYLVERASGVALASPILRTIQMPLEPGTHQIQSEGLVFRIPDLSKNLIDLYLELFLCQNGRCVSGEMAVEKVAKIQVWLASDRESIRSRVGRGILNTLMESWRTKDENKWLLEW